MSLSRTMRSQELSLIVNLLIISGFFLINKCNSNSNQENDWHFNRGTQLNSTDNSEPNDKNARSNSRTLRRPTIAPGSLADILMVDPNDPSQQPQPPLIFTSEHNPPEPVFGHINHNEDKTVIVWADNKLQLGSAPEPGAPQPNRMPPFFVKVESKSGKFVSNITQRHKNPDKGADNMPAFEPQPLPPSTKPVSEKRDCVVLGRAGSCFPFYPMQNVLDCFKGAGIVAMDIVRCSWVRACCVPNFF